jgi:hypothetical protein
VYLALLLVTATAAGGCVTYEKVIDLTYQHGTRGGRGSGGVCLAKIVTEERLPKLPGGRVVLGKVEGSAAQIVTRDNVEGWVQGALMKELSAEGYEVKTVPFLTEDVTKGVAARIERVSVSQEPEGLVLRTAAEVFLAVDIWKAGRLIKTLTVSAGGQDQGFDRSAAVVSSVLEETLRTALGKLMPAIVDNLRE